MTRAEVFDHDGTDFLGRRPWILSAVCIVWGVVAAVTGIAASLVDTTKLNFKAGVMDYFVTIGIVMIAGIGLWNLESWVHITACCANTQPRERRPGKSYLIARKINRRALNRVAPLRQASAMDSLPRPLAFLLLLALMAWHLWRFAARFR